jgi:sulfonate transport system permease protein
MSWTVVAQAQRRPVGSSSWPRAVRGLLVPLLLLGLWQAVTAAHLVPPHMLPSPHAVAERFSMELSGGTFWTDVSASVLRVFKGFFIGSTAGLLFGLMLGLSLAAERLFGPLFLAYRQIALFAWVPLLSMWLGGGEAGKIAFIALSAFAPNVVNTWRAIRAVPAPLRELAAVLTFRWRDYAALIALPGALPGILTGLRSALIHAWTATVGAELFLDIAAGLGGRLNEGRDKFEVDLMLVALAIIAALGWACSQIGAIIEQRLVRARAS